MRGLRNRRADVGGVQYQMHEKVFSIGDDFWIDTPDGERAFKVNGKALRLRDTLELESPSGETLLKIQEKKLSIRDKMEIERDGHTVATVKKALVGLRDRFTVNVESGGELKATGNIVGHEYAIAELAGAKPGAAKRGDDRPAADVATGCLDAEALDVPRDRGLRASELLGNLVGPLTLGQELGDLARRRSRIGEALARHVCQAAVLLAGGVGQRHELVHLEDVRVGLGRRTRIRGRERERVGHGRDARVWSAATSRRGLRRSVGCG